MIMSLVFEGNNALAFVLKQSADSSDLDVCKAISAWSWRHFMAIYKCRQKTKRRLKLYRNIYEKHICILD